MSLWDDLKKKAEGVVAQINPFDGGKDYDTVVNNKPVQTAVKRSPAVSITPAQKPLTVSNKPGMLGSQPSILGLPKPAVQSNLIPPKPKQPTITPPPTLTPQQPKPPVLQGNNPQTNVFNTPDDRSKPLAVVPPKPVVSPYSQKISEINGAFKAGKIDKATQIKMINQAVDDNAPKQPSLNAVESVVDQGIKGGTDLVKSVASTGQKVFNTGVAAATGVIGAVSSDPAIKQAAIDERKNMFNNAKTVTGDKATFFDGYDQAMNTNGDLLGNTIAPATRAVTEIAPYVFPYAKVAEFAAPVAPIISKAAAPYLSRIGGQVAGKGIQYGAEAGIVSGAMAANDALHQVATTGEFDPMEATKAGLINGVLEGVGHGVIDGAGAAIPHVRAGAQKLDTTIRENMNIPVQQAAKAAEEASGIPKTNVINDNEAHTLSDYADIVMNRWNAPNDVRNQVTMQARNAAQTAGFDITNMSPADANRVISVYLEARDNFKTTYFSTHRRMTQGGYAKIPGIDEPPLNSKLPADKAELLAEAERRGLSVSKQKLSPELRKEIDDLLYDREPDLFYKASDEGSVRQLNEDGSSAIPRIHTNDLKRYFGNTESIPSKYKRASGPEDIDTLAKNAGFDDVDQFVEAVQTELSSRGDQRMAQQKLAELRKAQDVIQEAQKRIDARTAKTEGLNQQQESRSQSSPDLPERELLMAEARSRGLVDDSGRKITSPEESVPISPDKQMQSQTASRSLDNSTLDKAVLLAEAKRRKLLAQDTPPVEAFGPEPTFETVKRTAATEFYDGTMKRADLDDAPDVTDATPVKDIIEAKQNKAGEQFAKPRDSFERSKGRMTDEPAGTILSESKDGNQRKRLYTNEKTGAREVIVETKEDGAWTVQKEPAIAHPGDDRGIGNVETNQTLQEAAIKAIDSGEEMHFYASKNTGDNLTADVVQFDPEKMILDGGLVRSAKDNKILGNHIKVDDTGMSMTIGKKVINMDSIVGNVSKWKDMNHSTWTMDRMLEAAAPNKEVYQATRKFIIEHKQSAEAKMRGDLRTYREDIGKQRKNLLAEKPSGMSKDDYMQDIFFYAEKKLAQPKDIKDVKLSQDGILNAKYGTEKANKIREFDKWSRNQYDSLLDRTNEVLRRFGHDEVPKRQNYMTHLQEDSFWDQIGIGEDLYRDLSSGISGETNPTNRGKLPGTIVGKTEQFKPTKKYNPFHQTRRGNKSMTDPFRAMDAYGEAALFNIHMTEAAVRSRSLESVFIAAEKITQKDMIKQVNEDLSKSLKESYGGSRGDLVAAFQEYANAMAGKSNQFDRKLQDGAGKAGRSVLRVSRLLQKVASNASIVGNVSVTVAQTLNIPNVIGTNGVRNTLKGVSRMMADTLPNGEPRAGSPSSMSDFLKVRYTDASSKINRSPLQTANDNLSKATFMLQTERAMVETAWNATYEKALADGFKGNAAIKEADRMAERVVGGRGIADQPDLYRSTAARTFLQYTLEVNSALKNIRKDMTPAGLIKYAAAVYVMNYGVEALTGRAPLPDFIGAGIDTATDFANTDSYNDKDGDGKPDETLVSKAIKGVQRFGSTAAGLNPWASAGFNLLSQDARKAVFGADSDLGRYDGSPAAAQVISKLMQGMYDLTQGEPGKAFDKSLAAIPYGGQIRKTSGGISTMLDGVSRDASGSPTAAVDTSNPLTWVQAALFGKNAIPEVVAYYKNDGKSLGDKQTKVFDTIKQNDGIKSATEYMSSIMDSRDAAKDAKSGDVTGSTVKQLSAEAKVNIADGSWEEKDGVIVHKDTGEIVRSYYKKLAKAATEGNDTSDNAYDAYIKAYDLKEQGGGKAAETGNSTLDQLNKLSSVTDSKDVITQAVDLIKKSKDGYDDIPSWVTDKYLVKNSIDRGDALYAAKSSYANENKIPVVRGDIKDKSHSEILDYLATGRTESITGGFWASQGVLADLRDEGVISKSEYSYLNKLKFNKDGTEQEGSVNKGGGSRGSTKAKTVSASEIAAANSTTELEKALAAILKKAGERRGSKSITYKKRK